MMPNPYEILGVRSSASDDDIKRAYREKAREAHPDAGGDADSFALLTEAYDLLLDPIRRAEFERTGVWDGGGSILDPNADIYAEVGMAIASAMSDRRMNPEGADIIEAIRVHYAAMAEGYRAANDADRARAAIIEKNKRRLKSDYPFLVRLVEEAVRGSDAAIKKRALAADRADRIVDFLSGVSWDFESPRAPADGTMGLFTRDMMAAFRNKIFGGS